MKKIDLHIHTNYSDGLLSPKEVLELAKERGYDVIAITDHDNLGGYRAAKNLAETNGIELIPGVEISSFHKGRDVHILAYNIDTENEKLNILLKSIYDSRYGRAKKIIEKLNEQGIKIGIEQVQKLAGENNYLGRPHISRTMINMRYCEDKYEAFEKYIGEHCYAYVPKSAPSSKKVIKAIRRAGGISVLAHPYSLRDDRLVYDLIRFGIDGLEVFYAKSNDETIYHYNEIAQNNYMIRTGGSDFHGEGLDLEIFGNYTAPEFVLDELNRGNYE